MLKRIKRSVVLLATTALLLTAFAPVGLLGQAEASSSNWVSNIATVDESKDLSTLSVVPMLTIKVDEKWAKTTQVFSLSLDKDAEWNELSDATGFAADGIKPTSAALAARPVNADRVTLGTPAAFTAPASDTAAQLVSATLNSAANTQEFVIELNAVAAELPAFIYVPLNVTVGTEGGEYSVTVVPNNSDVSASTHKYAIVSGDKTVTSVSGSAKNISRMSRATGAVIMINEAYINSIDSASDIRLRLPYGFAWHADMLGSGFMSSTGSIQGVAGTAIENDGRELVVEVTPKAAAVSYLSRIEITPIFTVKMDAKQGDVLVQQIKIAGDIASQSDLKVAVYKDFGIEVTAKSVAGLWTGSLEQEFWTDVITVKETAPNSFVKNRPFDVELPVGINLWAEPDFSANAAGAAQCTTGAITNVLYKNKFQIDVANIELLSRDGQLKYFKMELPVVASGDFVPMDGTTKDVSIKVAQTGLSGETVVLKAVNPITVTIKMADVKLGYQNQVSADITIKENDIGAISRYGNANKTFNFVMPANYGVWWTGSPKVEVLEGDIIIDEKTALLTADNKRVTLIVQGSSSKASTIKISGLTITTDRTVPEGPLAIGVGGPAGARVGVNYNSQAVVNYDNAAAFFSTFSTYLGEIDYANMITPAERDIMAESQFTIGSTTYKMLVDGVWVDKTMDAAPFILNGRTMVPLRFVGEALGATVRWEDESSSAILMQGTLVVRVQPGSKTMLVNGTPIMMDVAAVNKAGRMYLPVSQVGLAMNATSSWDAATQTATFKVFPR